MKKPVYTFLQWTWGLPQTLLGSALYIAHRKKRHFNYNGACATLWDRPEGLSLGKFIFLPSTDAREDEDGNLRVDNNMADHEFGHTVQSLILGPTYLFFIGAPSIIWNRLPYFINKRKKTGRSYYSPIFEKTANSLGKGKKK